MSRTKALISLALLTLLAGGLYHVFGDYGFILTGITGLCLGFGMRWVEVDDELRSQSYTIAPLEDPMLDSQYAHENSGRWAWVWTAVILAYSVGLGVLGFALAAQDYPPQG